MKNYKFILTSKTRVLGMDANIICEREADTPEELKKMFYDNIYYHKNKKNFEADFFIKEKHIIMTDYNETVDLIDLIIY